jgi:phage anti-repressor protein
MKKKSDGMSPDMFHDATSSTPIPVFTTNEETKNESQNLLQKKTDDFTSVPNGTPVKSQNELIKIDFDKQTVSARALYEFLAPTERFNFWCKRMFSYGLIENVDFTTVNFLTVVNNSGTKEIGDYLLTIDAAKHIAMVQRNEKGKQARQYFINVEKRYLKTLSNKEPEATSTVLLDKFLNLLVELEEAMIQQNDYKSLAEQKLALEQKLAEQAA